MDDYVQINLYESVTVRLVSDLEDNFRFLDLTSKACERQHNGKSFQNYAEKYNQFWYNRHFNETSPIYMKAEVKCNKELMKKEHPLDREKTLKLGYAFLPLFESGVRIAKTPFSATRKRSSMRKYCGNKSEAIMAHHVNRARKCYQCDQASQTPIMY
ncbi:hypothetical protein CRE_27768 [Caenorhabditis remanei]|uniref:Uncharacterized protein n=1 Tax=Caenorhabditis remanei TaxID=31234 RepID=E3MXN0_CAERE|nr:hypothetical protein CRE_27768 [Caenorhabditis remanei]